MPPVYPQNAKGVWLSLTLIRDDFLPQQAHCRLQLCACVEPPICQSLAIMHAIVQKESQIMQSSHLLTHPFLQQSTDLMKICRFSE